MISSTDGSTIIMDDDYAPRNSDIELVEKRNDGKNIINYLVLSGQGAMEDHNGIILEETRELLKVIRENPEIKVIAKGKSFCSLAELTYTLQSPTRQLYRATMADLNQIINNRFEKDDAYLRELCNKAEKSEKVNEENKEEK